MTTLSNRRTIVAHGRLAMRELRLDAARLLPRIPREALKVAESGITRRKEMDELAAKGFDAFLVGERFMSERDPGAALARLLDEPS